MTVLPVQAQDVVTQGDTTLNATLGEVVVEGAVRGNYLSSAGIAKHEMITRVGLKKMACCTLAESFENSAAVSVGYSDAVSGTRQIRLLGLAGIYTQFLDESRPTMRGLSAPYALSHISGDWLQSIQVSKGISSVTTGHEAITGQINLEFRKPTDNEKLHLNLYFDDMLRPEVNLTSAIALNEDKSLSTVFMAHGSIDTDWREMGAMDRNKDGFRDQPRTRQLDVANRWFWLASSGLQLRWGGRFTLEERLGGQMHFSHPSGKEEFDQSRALLHDPEAISDETHSSMPMLYGSHIDNRAASAYLKLAVPLPHVVSDGEGGEWQDNIAMIADYDHFRTRSYFGYNDYNVRENGVSLSVRFDHYFAPQSTLAVGLQGRINAVRGELVNFFSHNEKGMFWHCNALDEDMDEREVGLYGEWTHTFGDKLTLVAGVRGDYNDWCDKLLFTPRAHIKWDIAPKTVLRASAGMGYRTPRSVIENLGILATGYEIKAEDGYRDMEKALTVGGSLTQTFKLGRDNNASLSLDFFHTHFFRSLVATQEPWGNTILLCNSKECNRTSTWQLDFNWTPVERLELLATFRYTHSRLAVPVVESHNTGGNPLYLGNGHRTVSRPLMSRFKGLINLQYATRFRIWVFDITGQLNGPARVPGGKINLEGSYNSPTYCLLFAQVTHKIGRAEVYAGCENITDYRQLNPIIGADEPFTRQFNSMNVWGPLMGRKFYVGFRWNLY
ncbi:MAG: TonB-dependent receptor [Muribaculaceae bacterium]|nr:TonB-dependent receptor [Muribaculaceae bacterium]